MERQRRRVVKAIMTGTSFGTLTVTGGERGKDEEDNNVKRLLQQHTDTWVRVCSAGQLLLSVHVASASTSTVCGLQVNKMSQPNRKHS
jgi:hypothetical protein